MNWTVGDTQIARIADKLPASSIYMFSYTNLELTDIQISNASGEIQVTNVEIRVKMLERLVYVVQNLTPLCPLEVIVSVSCMTCVCKVNNIKLPWYLRIYLLYFTLLKKVLS